MKDDKVILNGDLRELKRSQRFLAFCLVVTIVANVYQFYEGYQSGKQAGQTVVEDGLDGLYLMEQAAVYCYDVEAFERKVRAVSGRLYVPPEWLMAVMHSESRFDASVGNFKGSGATGLIQFMPATAKDFNVTVEKLRNMNHVEQLDYVYQYLDSKRRQYGDYETLTELYLAILYPKSLEDKSDYCFSLYAKGSKAYQQNSGLDFNKDGNVTVLDIDRRLQSVYPTAYMAEL